jgi:hypothetical protein
MHVRPSNNEDHVTSEFNLLPQPVRFVRNCNRTSLPRPLIDCQEATRPGEPQRNTQQRSSTLKRSQYNRLIGEVIQTEIECSCNLSPTQGQLHAFEEVWLTISSAENE